MMIQISTPPYVSKQAQVRVCLSETMTLLHNIPRMTSGKGFAKGSAQKNQRLRIFVSNARNSTL